jgi:hypothetical protein
MSISRNELEAFFSSYAKALSSRDVEAIVGCWGVPTLVLSDQGAIPASQIQEVHTFFSSSLGQYEGVTTAKPTITAFEPLSEKVIACQITWDHLDQAGTSVGGELAYYILKHDGERLRIHVYTPMSAG